MLSDLRFAFRQLWKNPGFTFVAVVALALGIGANTAIFSVVNAVLLKPLPFPDSERLVALGMTNLREQRGGVPDLYSFSFPDFFDLRAQNQSFSSVAIYRDRALALTGETEAKSVRGQVVSAEFFDVLGVRPLLGRTFQRAEEAVGGGPDGFTVVLSHGFWQRNFRSDATVLGRQLTLDSRVYSIVGVMPAGFQFPIETEGVDLYVSIAYFAANADGSKPNTEQRGNHSMRGVARLRAGIPLEQAQGELSTLAAALTKQYPETNTGMGMGALALREDLVGDVRTGLWVLTGAVACVLLIASANVANLLLARASARGREMAVRSALGAGRARIVRQLLTESFVLAVLGGALGLLLAHLGTTALLALVPQNIPRAADIQLDAPVLGFTLLVALGAAVIFGLAPAWQASRIDLADALKSGARGNTSAGRNGLRRGLVVAQTATALVLLIGAGLLLRSFAELGRVQPGLRTERLLTARVALPDAAYPKSAEVLAFYDRFLPQLRSIPGVRAVSTVLPLPMGGGNMTSSFDIEERPKPEGERADSPSRIVGPDYFETMGVPLRRGRLFAATDRPDTPQVVIINERFAEQFFPGQDPIGKRIQPSMSADDSPPPMREIIGVVGNVKHRSLRAEFTPEMYVPLLQMPVPAAVLVLRTETSDLAGVTSAVRAALAGMDRNLPLTRVRVFDDYVSHTLARPRFNALLLSIFAGVALVLTAVGIYGVMAYSVAQRTGEIGVRMALGAERTTIFRLVVGEGMTLVAVSIGFGLAGAFGLTRLLSSLLYGVGAWDPVTFGVLSLIIALVAFLACWLPARRAARVNPIEALRAE